MVSHVMRDSWRVAPNLPAEEEIIAWCNCGKWQTRIGPSERRLRVVAEAGMCANSVEWAHTAVNAAAEAGLWGFKVQLLSADTLAAKGAPRYDRLAGPADQYEAFTGALPYSAWAEVYDHAREKGLEPFASCWDEAAVHASEELLKPEWYKIGSADITHLSLIREIAATGKGIILSTGAATADEIERAVDQIWHHSPAVLPGIVLMACSLSYPCYMADARLSRVLWLRDLGVVVSDEYGYSDHTLRVETGGLAVAAGASWLEKHFTVTPGEGGDHDFALNPVEMWEYVRLAERAFAATYSAEGNDQPLTNELPARDLARRSLHTTSAVSKGDKLIVGKNTAWLRPAKGGIPADTAGPWYAMRDYEAGEQV